MSKDLGISGSCPKQGKDDSKGNPIAKIKDESRKQQVKKQIKKIIDKPTIGKTMRYARKNTREVYIGSFQLAYAYVKQEKTIIFFSVVP